MVAPAGRGLDLSARPVAQAATLQPGDRPSLAFNLLDPGFLSAPLPLVWTLISELTVRRRLCATASPRISAQLRSQLKTWPQALRVSTRPRWRRVALGGSPSLANDGCSDSRPIAWGRYAAGS